MNLLFVCTGNTCRSPLAEVLARAEAERRGLGNVRSASAGTFAQPGQPAAARGIEVAAARGLDLRGHRSRELDPRLASWADEILAMTPSHLEAVEHLRPSARVRLLTEYLPVGHPSRGRPVPDPFGGDGAQYERTFVLLEEAIRGLFDALEDRSGGAGGPRPGAADSR